MKKLFLYLISASFIIGCTSFEQVDLIVHNANIYSVDEAFSVHEAMAIRGDSIVDIGAENQILNKYRSIEKIDAAKFFIYPGFIDAHSHFIGYSKHLSQLDLLNSKSESEMHERLIKFKSGTEGKWILGRGWDQNLWDDKKFPDKEWLDENLSAYYVILKRVDGHAALVNSAVLKLAGINEETIVEGGKVEVLNGKCTGILIDNAVDLVTALLPDMDEKTLLELVKKAERNCFEKGLTSISDAGLSFDDVQFLKKWHETGELHIKTYIMLEPSKENFSFYLQNGPIRQRDLSISSFKFYVDGALGSRGACLLQPYSDEIDNHGFLLTSVDSLKNYADRLFNNGFQMNCHAIGDSANRAILKIYSQQLKESNDKRWRIEHAQVVHKDDLAFFRDFNIIPSVQPTHATSDMLWAENRLGKDRIDRAYAYRDLMQQNGMIALGTDFPVEQIDPLLTLLSATKRTDVEGNPENGFLSEQSLSFQDALRGMTIWSAIANFEELHKGSLEQGKKADFVMFNRDLKYLDATNFKEYMVIQTFLNGKSVYKKAN